MVKTWGVVVRIMWLNTFYWELVPVTRLKCQSFPHLNFIFTSHTRRHERVHWCITLPSIPVMIKIWTLIWALGVKNSRGAPLEVQNGTQQDLNKMIDLVNFGGQKDRLHGGLRNETQQDLNKMVDKSNFFGGRAKRSSRCRKWGAKPRRIHTDSPYKKE